MATPPVLAEQATRVDAPIAKLPLVSMIVSMVIAVGVCAALLCGAMFYVIHSGKLALVSAVTTEAKTIAPATRLTHVMVLEPMVANLADAGGAAYLKVSVTLRIADEAGKNAAAAKEGKLAKGISDIEAAVRDTVLTVVGRQSADQLLSLDGKERLKSLLKVALTEHNPELKVVDIYFVDFLVQR